MRRDADRNSYAACIKINKEALDALGIRRDEFGASGTMRRCPGPQPEPKRLYLDSPSSDSQSRLVEPRGFEPLTS